MHHNLILSFLGWMTAVLAVMMALPILTALVMGETRALGLFIAAAIASGFVAGFMILTGRQTDNILSRVDLCLLAFLGWALGSMIGAVPLWMILDLSLAKTYFLSTSALTTTGAVIFENMNTLSFSIKLWLALLQWIGGAATILMAMMIFAPLGIGGMELRQLAGTKNESQPKQNFLHMIKISLPIYSALTFVCFLFLLFAGVSFFDALCMSFSTLSTGGMNLGIEGWVLDSPFVKSILGIFMLLGAMNVVQYYLLFRGHSNLRDNVEQNTYFVLVLVVALGLMGFLLEESGMVAEQMSGLFTGGWGEVLLDPRWRNAFGEGLFAAISVMSTTDWQSPGVELPFILTLLLTFIGGLTLSTAGGLKIMRVLLLLNQGRKELSILAYPHYIKSVYFEGRMIEIDLMQTVWVFFALFNASIAILMLILASTGLSFEHALAAAVAAISNAGPMVNMVGIEGWALYAGLPNAASWAMTLGMIGGRVELLALLGMLSPIYWKK